MDSFLFQQLQKHKFEKINDRIELFYGNSVKLFNYIL
jgi:hypothetical protein